MLDHIRQHLAQKAQEDGGDPEMLEINALDVKFPFEEERMVDLQDWLVSGGGLKDVDECIAAVRRQAAAEVRASSIQRTVHASQNEESQHSRCIPAPISN